MEYTPQTLSLLPQSPGVYRYFDAKGALLYIGKAVDLKKRVSSYFQKKDHDAKTTILVSQIYSIEITVVRSEFEALLLESELIRKYKPKYNVIWKDDKHYIYIKITHEKYPRILYARKDDDLHATHYGPFPSYTIVRQVLSNLRRIFPYCIQNPKSKRVCFYTHLGLCDPCPAEIIKMNASEQEIARKTYLGNIRHIKRILEGRTKTEEIFLRKKMEEYSKNLQFEKAALYRDKLQNLYYLTRDFHPIEKTYEAPFSTQNEWEKEQHELVTALHSYFPSMTAISRIECYDISNISGTLATGSMVTFIGGVPDKRYYRHFRISLVDGPNDFAMLREVMGRRLKHKEWKLPELFVIDGGKPQLVALKTVFSSMGISLPVIGIAKQEEELVIPIDHTFEKIKLKRNSKALHVIQRLRDEAHRFAKKYHTLLRVKQVLRYGTIDR